MAPVIIPNQSRTIVITPNMFAGDENKRILDGGELPKYAVGLFESNGPGPRKRKRLTHLTPEEKIMRRKLKNRVAAQTARDRKKAKLETLEEAVTKIHEQTKKLLDVNCQLLERTESLEQENQILRQKLGLENKASFTKDSRQELSIIKEEFNNIVTSQMLSSQGESSDDEGYCFLTPYEEANVFVDNRSRSESSMQEASECESPVPAAGSCQPSEADPLASRMQEAITPTSIVNNVIEPSKDDAEIASFLRQLEAIDPEQCNLIAINDKEGNAARSPEILNQNIATTSPTKVPIHVFRDHEYSKPRSCLLYSQDVLQAPSNINVCNDITTSLNSTYRDSKKLTALVEEPKKCTQQLELRVPSELMNAFAPCEENASAKNILRSDAIMDFSNMDAVFDSLINSDLRPEHSAETESVDSGVSTCDSPIPTTFLDTPSPLSDDVDPLSSVVPLTTFLDTPSPLSDCVDPFSSAVDCNFWDNELTTDLFPQLAVM